MNAAITIRTTCPRDCYDACGVLVKIAADGSVNVVGDPEHDLAVARCAANARLAITASGAIRAHG